MGQTNSADAAQAPPSSSIHSRDVRRPGRINPNIVQNVLLIWLDANIDERSDDCQNTIAHLRRTINTIHTFTDGRKCLQFLQEMVDEKACIIISGSLGKKMVPHVHNLRQVDSIFIFCNNKKFHEEWVRDWAKIKGVFNEIESVCEALKQAAQQCEQNAISISIMNGSDGVIEKTENRLDPSFMYTQIMKEILLSIHFEQEHFDEFIRHCRTVLIDNKRQLKHVDNFAREYHEKTPIWWYTCECFLYPMLNRALRLMDADLIIKMGFFIGDLHRQIEKLHKQQYCGHSAKKRFIVYRGQGMEKEAFKNMVANKGGLISFNSFLSTSTNPSISHNFSQRALTDDQMVGVLFVMNIDPARSTTPFAHVDEVGRLGAKENEVLFSMHTVFHIGEITPVSNNTRLVQVKLDLASENDNDLRGLIGCIRHQTFPEAAGWYRLGQVLWKMGEFPKAAEVYETLLKKETKEIDKGAINHQLGVMKQEQGEYAEAIAYYEKSIQIKERQYPRNDLGLALSYNNIGNVYNRTGDYLKALAFYEKDLEISQRSLSPSHPDLAASYNNIGNVHLNMNDYPKALASYEKALIIQQKSLPSTHPSLANIYNNMGLVHEKMGNYKKAHSCFESAMDIAQSSLPANHPILPEYRNNLTRIKKKM